MECCICFNIVEKKSHFNCGHWTCSDCFHQCRSPYTNMLRCPMCRSEQPINKHTSYYSMDHRFIYALILLYSFALVIHKLHSLLFDFINYNTEPVISEWNMKYGAKMIPTDDDRKAACAWALAQATTTQLAITCRKIASV